MQTLGLALFATGIIVLIVFAGDYELKQRRIVQLHIQADLAVAAAYPGVTIMAGIADSYHWEQVAVRQEHCDQIRRAILGDHYVER